MLNTLKTAIYRYSSLNLIAMLLLPSALVVSVSIWMGTTRAGAWQQPRPTNQLSAAHIAFTLRGFEPGELTVEHQDLLLTIVNKSGFINARFQLDREVGGRVHEVVFQNARQRAKQFLKLPPGRYILREASHPNFSCRITVAQR